MKNVVSLVAVERERERERERGIFSENKGFSCFIELCNEVVNLIIRYKEDSKASLK